ncbi:MAG: tRNA (adenosine(37)-N6)-threonylcarbamoyltransferase complex ATPase subunit type 1 TsaE [Candidatus Omnitrophica bacterium]|nr:tRNA (adenosine(37)-N6)-threonylcarbamoyltransferase complex ATPase subunit type 1 TsaE [Candidatus Omnitrophota bacterium]
MIKIISNSVKQTLKIGRRIARDLRGSDIICLFGQLGSGKTVLTKGIAGGLRMDKRRIISPSFVLIRQYNQGKLPLYHFDLYRLKAARDILALGYEEYLYGNGVTVIEWADRLEYLLPPEFLKIQLFIKGDKQRLFRFTAFGERYKELLDKIHENIRH